MTIKSEEDAYEFVCYGLDIRIGATKGYRINFIVNVIIHIIASSLAICLNVLVMLVILRHKKLRTPSNILLASTTITDIVWALTYMFCIVPFLVMSIKQEHSCTFYLLNIVFGYICATVSILSVNLISLDRYIAIYKPFYYNEKIKENIRAYVIVIVVLWVATIVYTVAGLKSPGFIALLVLALFNMAVSVSWPAYVYLKIFKTVREINRNIKNQQTVNRLSASERIRKKDIRLAKITSVMIISLFTCYSPQALLMGVWIYNPDLYTPQIYALFFWVLVILSLKWFINPLVFCLTVTEIRVCLMDFLRKSQRRTRRVSDFNGIRSRTLNIPGVDSKRSTGTGESEKSDC